MQQQNDIRWKQRYSNYLKALGQLEKFITKFHELNEMEEQGMIQAFEYTYELAWNTMKDFLQEQGNENIYGAKSTIQEAFKWELIADGQAWMQLFNARNKTSHTYNEATAKEILKLVYEMGAPCFIQLKEKMQTLM